VGFVLFAILGLISAIIAKVILKRKYGWIVTILLGLAGAGLGGLIGSYVFQEDMTNFLSPYSWLLAIGGSVIVLLVFGALTRNRKA